MTEKMDKKRERCLTAARAQISNAITSSDDILRLCNYLVSQGELTDGITMEIK